MKFPPVSLRELGGLWFPPKCGAAGNCEVSSRLLCREPAFDASLHVYLDEPDNPSPCSLQKQISSDSRHGIATGFSVILLLDVTDEFKLSVTCHQ